MTVRTVAHSRSTLFDYDWVIVGSGFGGSIAALRLAERGYSVCVLECGRRITPERMPKTSWDVRKYLWMPRLGCHGILRLTNFRDVSIISGAAVGGGSVVYAQTLYRATDKFRDAMDAAVGQPVELDPYYDVAERMLGAQRNPRPSSRDKILIAAAEDLGYGADAFHLSTVGVFRGEPGRTVPDPYFGGEGPDRAGCTDCGECILGCRHNAKNSLDKNYLYLAEKRGVEVRPDRMVTSVRPIGAPDGSEGYEIRSSRPGAWLRRREQVVRAKSVVIAAGAVGSNQLLAACKTAGDLPNLSSALGTGLRTNAESVCALTFKEDGADFTDGVSISGSLLAGKDGDLHLEAFTWGRADSMSAVMMPLSGDGTRLTRPLKLLAQIMRHPISFLRAAIPFGWSRRTIMVGGMWTQDGALRLKARTSRGGVRLQTEQDPDHPNPTYIPEMIRFVEHLAEKHDAIPQIWATEPFNRSFTAHILGGATIGTDRERSVCDPQHRVYGYQNLLVTDGSAVPFNPGVNPSLTISALAERAMSFIPTKDGREATGGVGYLSASKTLSQPRVPS